MGVMPCYRPDCENIMCRRWILSSSYICNECWDELVEYKNTWQGPMSYEEVRERIEEFMDTSPRTHAAEADPEIDRFFKMLTGSNSSDEED